MAETLSRQLPLAGAFAGTAAVRIEAAPAAERLVLRAGQEDAPWLSGVIGIDLPAEPRTSSIVGDLAALWLGPDEWLVIGEGASALGQAAEGAGVSHAAVDVSHRQTGILVSGPGAAAAINAGCPLDLRLSAFPVGAVARSLMGKAEIVLLRSGEERFRVEVWRSFADYVFALLKEGAADVAP